MPAEPKQSRKPIGLDSTALTKLMPGFADGIYLNMPNDVYHADRALGSSNIRDLLKGANLFWFKSWMNPRRPKEKLTDSKIVGNATHRLLLDGMDYFKAEYVRGPWGPDDDDLSSAEKGQLTKNAKKSLQEGQFLLTQEDYDFVVGCKALLDADPELVGCLDNGLSEVSCFWTRPDGVRCKVRWDKLKLKGIGDIKTIANEREREMPVACALDIHTYRYDIPGEHYLEGRRHLLQLVNDGKVFMCTPEPEDRISISLVTGKNNDKVQDQGERKLLDFLAACGATKGPAFQFVFIPKKGAPDAWSCVLSPGNEILLMARTDIEAAISHFRMAMEKYGPEKRWLPNHEVAELSLEDLPVGFGRHQRRR